MRTIPTLVLLLPAILLGHVAPARANDSMPEFVWSFTLEPQFDNDVWRVQLTPEIMQRLHRDSADDLVIVDQQGRPVPFARVPGFMFQEVVEVRQPLYFEGETIAQDQPESERPELTLEFEHNGSRLRVEAPENELRVGATEAMRYEALIALPAAKLFGNTLPENTPENFPNSARLELEFQTEQRMRMHCWLRSAAGDEPATRSHHLTIEQESRPFRYHAHFVAPMDESSWHMVCYGPEEPPEDWQLIKAEWVQDVQRDFQLRSTLVPEIQRQSAWPEVFEFELPAPYRADQINLTSGEQGVFSRVRVRSRANPEDSWRNRGEISLSTLDNANNEPLVMDSKNNRRDQYWQLQAEPPLGHVPHMEFHTLEDTLVFLAQGEPPWRLQVGSFAGVVPTIDDSSLRELTENLGAVMQWPEINVSEVEQIGSDRLLSPAIDWSRYLLWLVLVAGSLLVIVMAFCLLRTSNSG